MRGLEKTIAMMSPRHMHT